MFGEFSIRYGFPPYGFFHPPHPPLPSVGYKKGGPYEVLRVCQAALT